MIVGSIVIHELGHASVVLVKTRGHVAVSVGDPKIPPQIRVGRLSVGLSGRGWAGLCRFPLGQLSRPAWILQILAGPLSNLFAATMLWLAALITPWPIRAALISGVIVNGVTGLAELIPRNASGPMLRGLPTDGRQILCLLCGQPIPNWQAPVASLRGRPGQSVERVRDAERARTTVAPPSSCDQRMVPPAR